MSPTGTAPARTRITRAQAGTPNPVNAVYFAAAGPRGGTPHKSITAFAIYNTHVMSAGVRALRACLMRARTRACDAHITPCACMMHAHRPAVSRTVPPPQDWPAALPNVSNFVSVPTPEFADTAQLTDEGIMPRAEQARTRLLCRAQCACLFASAMRTTSI